MQDNSVEPDEVLVVHPPGASPFVLPGWKTGSWSVRATWSAPGYDWVTGEAPEDPRDPLENAKVIVVLPLSSPTGSYDPADDDPERAWWADVQFVEEIVAPALVSAIERGARVAVLVPDNLGPYNLTGGFDPRGGILTRMLVHELSGLVVDSFRTVPPGSKLRATTFSSSTRLDRFLSRTDPGLVIRDMNLHPEARPVATVSDRRAAALAAVVQKSDGGVLVTSIGQQDPTAEDLELLVEGLRELKLPGTERDREAPPRYQYRRGDHPAFQAYKGMRSGDLSIYEDVSGNYFLQYLDGKEPRTSRWFENSVQTKGLALLVLEAVDREIPNAEVLKATGAGFSQNPAKSVRDLLPRIRAPLCDLLQVERRPVPFSCPGKGSLFWNEPARSRVGRAVRNPVWV